MLRHASLVMVFSDLLAEPGPILESLYRLRHGGHDVILFHILDEAEVHFPFHGMVELEDPEDQRRLAVDADAFRGDYLAEVEAFRDTYRRECFASPHRLRAPGHEHAVRLGADGVFDQSIATRMIRWTCITHSCRRVKTAEIGRSRHVCKQFRSDSGGSRFRHVL